MRREAVRVIGPSIAYLPITKGELTVIESDDIELVNQFAWFAHLSTNKKNLRVVANVDGKTTHLSRYLVGCHSRLLVDHVNGRTLDNRRHNLRVATHKQNSMNVAVSSRSSTGVRGVTWRPDRQCYLARVFEGTKVVWRGHYPTVEDAAAAITHVHRERHGEFARKA